MTGPVSYRLDESVAFITMDDGKVNVIGPSMQQALNEALDHADRDDVGAVVIAGNQRVFSGGFDLKVLTSGEVQPAIDMLKGGFELSYRLLSYPKPVVMACTGHAIAMGAFLLASGDHRVAAPAYNVQANEVAIGMTIPYAALEVMKLRLTRSAYQQAAGLAKTFFGETAIAAGWSGRGSREGICHAQATGTRRDEVADSGRSAGRDSGRDRRYGRGIRHLALRRCVPKRHVEEQGNQTLAPCALTPVVGSAGGIA
jgi:enoyl-CoA hydratase